MDHVIRLQRQAAVPPPVRDRPRIDQETAVRGNGDEGDRRAVLAVSVHGARRDRHWRRRFRWPLHDAEQRHEGPSPVQLG